MCLDIRGIGKNQVEWFRRRFLEVGKDVPLPDIALQVAMEKVVPDALDRFLVLLNKRGGRRTPAERLDPEGAGACVEVEHARAGNIFRQTGKNDLPDAVLRWAQGMTLRRFQVQAAGAAGDDAERHVRIVAAVYDRALRNLQLSSAIETMGGGGGMFRYDVV